MHRFSSGGLRYLLAATESVGDDGCVLLRCPHRRQEHSFANRLGYCVLLFGKAEGAGHTAAAGVQGFEVSTRLAQQGFFVGHLHDGFVMTMSVEEYLLRQLRRLIARSMLLQEFAEQESLFA